MESYGLHEQFEQAAIHHFCSDKQFFHLFHEFIEPDLLSSEPAKLAVNTAKAIYKDINDAPGNVHIVLNRVSSLLSKGKIDIGAYSDLAWYLSDSVEMDSKACARELAPTLKERARHLVTLQTIEKKASRSSLSEIASKIDKIEKIGEYVEGRAPLSLDDDSLFDALVLMANLDRWGTGIDELDMCINGGLPRGNLGVLIARPGGGKSLGLSQFGAYAYASGKTVAHIVISEIPGEIGGARVLAPIIGMRISDISRDPMEAKRQWHAYKATHTVGGYKVFDFQSKTPVSVIREQVMSFYKKFNTKPDVILFDYLGLSSSTRAPKTANSYTMGEYITTELRDWAKEENLWIWTAAQSQRLKKGGKGSYIVGLDDIADSYHVVRIADIVISFNTVETDEPGLFTGQFFVAKHRVGPSGQLTSMCPVNWDTGMLAPSSRFIRSAPKTWSMPSYEAIN